MKTLILSLLTFLSYTAHAQTIEGFPTKITNSSLQVAGSVNQANDDFEQRCYREGVPGPTGFEATGFVWSGLNTQGGQSVGTIQPIPPGYAYYLKSVTLSSTRQVRLKGGFGYYAVGNTAVQFNSQVVGGPSGSVVINVGSVIRPGMGPYGVNIISMSEADPLLIVASAVNGSTGLVTTKNPTLTPLANQAFSYSVSVTNSTSTSLTGTTTLTDVLPTGVRLVAVSGSGWSTSVASGTITATTTAILAPGTNSAPLSVTVAPTINAHISGSGNGWLIDCDNDYSAPHIMPIIGTSISAGSGASNYKTMWSMLFRNWLRNERGYHIRRINKSVSGSTTTDHDNFRLFDNRYDFDTKTGVWVYEHGVNNKSTNVPDSKTVADLVDMIRHKQRKAPTAKMLVLAPFPVTNAALEAGLATLSPQMAAAVASVGDPNIIWIGSTRTCFNPALDTTDGIHPNDGGNLKIFQAVRDDLNALNIQF
ncbi:SGNH/GDSL hydrolase family protein [Spirosoma sordidisoli]|uniref:SGNH/GDSL hydrolase family protein n=1 Tax=Spirosoma sordidisoli TaxID=2502893 RepID=A0A4Q2UKS1_9BACT|nr:SGNH/GDSL hydrolase family protein [Spirosoma sordidisoli]RYC69826.1 SGNH/GDSL hydrolase family protein [Spirosoma sordidisoli]